MNDNQDRYQVVPFPKIRRLMVDGGQLARHKHVIHGLVEMDVTRARRILREHRQRSGESLSFTAFFMACLGQVVAKNKHMQAMRTWRERLVIFDDVDINTMFEVEENGRKIIRPHILRAVDKKSFRQLHDEVRAFQAGHAASREAGFIDRFVLLPGPLRRLFMRILFKNPHRLKAMNGTVSLTAVGMFGTGGGWGIPVTNHTLQVTLGGIEEQPRLVQGRLENREFLSVTISFDHDIIDGAPAARFTQRLQELVDSAALLDDLDR